MADFTPQARVKNCLDNVKLQLRAPTPGHSDKKASLAWNIFANNPRIIVYTNDPNDSGESKGWGKITANLDLMEFGKIMHLITVAAKTETANGFKDFVECKNYTFPGGKRSAEPSIVSTVFVGKDKDGVVWMAVQAPDYQNRPKIQFKFAGNEFHNWVHADGTPYTAAEASVLSANAYVNVLEPMMMHMACTNYVEPVKKDPPGGNRGGYNNNRGGNQGGGNSNRGSAPASSGGDVDDDLPF